MQVTASSIQYSTKKSQVFHSAFDLTSKFPGTDVLALTFSNEKALVYDFKTPRFASIVTHPESKRLVIKFISAPDTDSPDGNGTPEHDKADDGDIQDEVPKFKFRREGNGSMVIVDKEQHDLMFPQFKAHAMRKAVQLSRIPGTQVLFLVSRGPSMVAAFATPKLLPFLTQPEGWKSIKACLEPPEPAI